MALTGRIPVEFVTVFPPGAYAVEVVAVQRFDEQARNTTGRSTVLGSGDLFRTPPHRLRRGGCAPTATASRWHRTSRT